MQKDVKNLQNSEKQIKMLMDAYKIIYLLPGSLQLLTLEQQINEELIFDQKSHLDPLL